MGPPGLPVMGPPGASCRWPTALRMFTAQCRRVMSGITTKRRGGETRRAASTAGHKATDARERTQRAATSYGSTGRGKTPHAPWRSHTTLIARLTTPQSAERLALRSSCSRWRVVSAATLTAAALPCQAGPRWSSGRKGGCSAPSSGCRLRRSLGSGGSGTCSRGGSRRSRSPPPRSWRRRSETSSGCTSTRRRMRSWSASTWGHLPALGPGGSRRSRPWTGPLPVQAHCQQDRQLMAHAPSTTRVRNRPEQRQQARLRPGAR